jgi:hypothetical protein
MGGGCSTYGEIGVCRLRWENLMERDHLEDRYRWEDNIKMRGSVGLS